MNLRVTLFLLLAILLMMLGAGGGSAYISYLMGREALKVVTQPDTDSAELNKTRLKPLGGSHKGLNIIDEKTVLVNVYDHIHQKKNIPYQQQSAISVNTSSPKEETKSVTKPEFVPLTNKSGGVTLEIFQAKIEGNSVLLEVNFKNESSQAVRFLYSFLDVRDENNRPLSAIADGLPGEIPPNGKSYPGKFIIPLTLLNDSQQISLSLQDYPEQRLNLQIKGIPVAR